MDEIEVDTLREAEPVNLISDDHCEFCKGHLDERPFTRGMITLAA